METTTRPSDSARPATAGCPDCLDGPCSIALMPGEACPCGCGCHGGPPDEAPDPWDGVLRTMRRYTTVRKALDPDHDVRGAWRLDGAT